MRIRLHENTVAFEREQGEKSSKGIGELVLPLSCLQLRIYQRASSEAGDYLISKDNYNENSIVIHRMTVVPTPDFSVSATPSSQTVTQGNSTTYTA